MMHNPDHYPKGTRVTMSQEALRQGLHRHKRPEGTITSERPIDQTVTVRWLGKRMPEQWHVDLLDLLK